MAAAKRIPPSFVRHVSTATGTSTKAAGDISSVFPSLSGKAPEPLPQRFQALKIQLSKGKEAQLKESWERLLFSLQGEVKKIKALGSDVSEGISYSNTNDALFSYGYIPRLFHRSTTKMLKMEL